MLKLVGNDGVRYYSWNLSPGKFFLGRSADCDFHIINDTVSRRHAEIEVSADGEKVFVKDLDSHNGTAVNGQRISSRVTITVNDLLHFGQVEFKLVPLVTGREKAAKSSVPTLTDAELEKSVVLSLDDALAPLPSQITDLPNVLPTLFDMAKMLVLPEPEEVLLERSLQLVAQVIPAERLAVLFTAEDENQVYVAATLLPEGKDPGSFTLSTTIVKEVTTQKNAVLIGDPSLDSRFSGKESIIRSALKSAMAVPLFDEKDVLGILYIDTTNPLHQFNDDYLRLLATFGNIIAARLANNSLLQERQEKEVLEAELKRAALIQSTLLASEAPLVPGYQVHAFLEPSRQVGGDLYDMTLLDDGSLLFLVADVCGKGMGAALLMSNILASFRILYHTREFDLLHAVELASQQLCRYSRSGDFATLFIGVLDPGKNEIRYVNAGHNAPLLVRQQGQIEYLEASGTMIGAFDFVEWREERQMLEAGDLLFIYTDGVTEAETASGEMYSDERTEQTVTANRQLAPAALAELLVQDVRRFVGDAPSSDDITMLILKRDN